MRAVQSALLVASVLQLAFAVAADRAAAAPREPCVEKTKGDRAGECRRLSECPSARSTRRFGVQPQLCGSPPDGTVNPYTCCPLDREENRAPTAAADPRTAEVSCAAFNKTSDAVDVGSGPGRLARRMCLKFQTEICNGKVSRAMQFDVPPLGAHFSWAKPLEFPHMALLGYGESEDDIDYRCGGSLISPDYVLTAAHCVYSGELQVRWVVLGVLNRTESLADKSTRQLLRVADVVVHPEYKAGARYHDIALLHLAEKARLHEEGVRPACLHTDLDGDTDALLGKLAVVTGWGAEAFDEEGSEGLLKGKVTVRQLSECRTLGQQGLQRGLDSQSHLCAGGDGVNPTDPCHGDSGGPLQFPAIERNPGCMFRVAGVVSFGAPCGIGLPGVYTKVAQYVPWIESVVWPRTSVWRGDWIPSSGPGSVARRACDGYMRTYCPLSGFAYRTSVPGSRPEEQCHFHETVPHTVAGFNEFPHQVQVKHGIETTCAGVLVAPNYVLTAAHCARLDCCMDPTEVWLGRHHRASRTELVEYDGDIVAVARVFLHPQYDPRTRSSDIALLRLAKPVPRLGVYSRPACLQTERDEDPLRQPLVASGMTATGRWDNVEGEMRKVTVGVEDAAACRKRLPAEVLLARGLADSQLCTKPGAAPVPGETGGPIQYVHRVLDGLEVHRVVGILSRLSPCGSGLPDVYTKVADFVPWIESVVWPAV